MRAGSSVPSPRVCGPVDTECRRLRLGREFQDTHLAISLWGLLPGGLHPQDPAPGVRGMAKPGPGVRGTGGPDPQGYAGQAEGLPALCSQSASQQSALSDSQRGTCHLSGENLGRSSQQEGVT